MTRRISRNNNYSSGIRPSGIFRATVTAVNGSLVNVKIPRLGLDNIYEDCPVVGPTPSVNDNIFVGFLEGKTSSPVALTSTDANTGDIDSVVAGTALSGGGSSGDVTLNFAPSELSSATVSTSDKIVIADADDSDNPKTVTVQSIVDLSPVGDITGVTAGTGISGGGTSGAVTVDFAPSELSSVTVATDDKVVIADTSDSDNPKTVTVQSIADLSTPGGSTSQIQYNNSGSFAGSANFTFDGTSTITLTDTDAGSEAAPIIELYRNSASPADSDYLGQIKFQGENDADQKVVYAKITGKIDDASDTTEDGILEVMLQKAGSNNIAMRFTSTDMKLINGTGLQVDGNVGIGITTPQQLLDVAGDSPRLRLTDTDTALSDDELSSAIEFFSSDASGTGVAAYIHADGDGSTGNLQLQLGTGTPGAAADRITIAADGDVGIGTTSPTSRLEVRDSLSTLTLSSTATVPTANTELQAIDFYQSDASGGAGVSARIVGSANNASGAQNIEFHTGQSGLGTVAERMRIDSNGDVGIGTASPTHTLTVDGNTMITANQSYYINSSTVGDGRLRLHWASSTGHAYVDYKDDLNFRADGTGSAVTFKADGTVGIGTASPAKTLDVDGNIRATGHVQTDEVRDNTGQQLILGAGESQGKFSGHTNEYVYVEAEQGLMVSTPSVNNFGSGYTEWQTIIRGGPADGGIRMGQWQSSSTYNFIGTANYSGSEYTLLMSSTSTYLSCGTGGTVFIRPSANTDSGLRVNLSGVYIHDSFPGVSGYYTVRRRNSDGLLGYASSSQRYKENIADSGSDWQQIYNLRPVTFDWKESTFTDTGGVAPSDRSDFGLIAEEVASVLPRLAEYRVIEGQGDDPVPDSVDYEKLSVYLLSAIKDLKARIEVLEG